MEQIAIVYQMPFNKYDIDETNQVCYDHCATHWDRFPFPDSLPQFVERYSRPQLGNPVLDVGSGTGVLAQWLTKKGFKVLCIDPSSEMVRRTTAKGLETVQCTLQSFEGKGPYGMIFAILSLIHVPKADFDQQLKKLASLLQPGGILFLGMIEGQGEGFFEAGKYPRFFSYYSYDEVIAKTAPSFVLKDYSATNSGGIGYMLFVLEKR